MVEDYVPHMLTILFTMPLFCLVGAQLWQLLPVTTSIRLTNYRLLFVTAFLAQDGLNKVTCNPPWSLEEALKALRGNKKGR